MSSLSPAWTGCVDPSAAFKASGTAQIISENHLGRNSWAHGYSFPSIWYFKELSCTSLVDSCQCMAKPIQYRKVKLK